MKAIILGTGVAGPNLAIALKKLNVQPIIFEANKTLSTAGAGFSLAPNGLRALDTLISPSLYKDTINSGEKLTGVDISESTGNTLLNLNVDYSAKFGYPKIGIRRHEFIRLAVDHAKKLGVEVKFGKRAINIVQQKDYVEVKFDDGSVETGDILFGCDGIHSIARRTMFSDIKPDYSGKTTYLGLSNSCPELNKMTMVIGNNNTFGTYPIGNGVRIWFLAADFERKPTESWTTANVSDSEIDNLKLEYSDWSSPVPEIINGAYQTIRWSIFDRPALDSWHNGRVVLVGDAAHPMTPNLGQGANQALEDVGYLAACFKKYGMKDLDLVLKSYDRGRIPRTSMITNNARKIGANLFIDSNPVVKLARNAFLKFGMPIFYTKFNQHMYGYKIDTV